MNDSTQDEKQFIAFRYNPSETSISPGQAFVIKRAALMMAAHVLKDGMVFADEMEWSEKADVKISWDDEGKVKKIVMTHTLILDNK